jgi:hypothetical protein
MEKEYTMRHHRPFVVVVSACLASAALGIHAQSRSPQPPAQSAAAPVTEALTLQGCLTAAPEGTKGFVLQNATTAGAKSDVARTPAAGTSATGESPSGTVTGQTPTGSTATTTSAPTPAVGAAGATANPASPTFNQDATAGTTGTVARPDTPDATTVREYRLSATSGVNLREHVGHIVQVTGRLVGNDASGTAATAEVRGAARKGPVPPPHDTAAATPPLLTLDVQAIQHIAPSCDAR